MIVTLLRAEDWDSRCLICSMFFINHITYVIHKLNILSGKDNCFYIKMCFQEFIYLHALCNSIGYYTCYDNGMAQLYFKS